MRHFVTALALVFALSCTQDTNPPKVTDDAGSTVTDPCEDINKPPPCWDRTCAVGQRQCSTERVCQVWDDCASGSCFQCRVRVSCDCR